MRNKLSIIIFALFLMLSFGSVEQILACSCYPSMPCQNYQNADISFFGKAIEKKQTKNNTYQTTFEVYKEYKNRKSQKEIEIYSRNDEGICGYNFEVGKEYIVFANKTKSSSEIKGFWTGSCYGNVRTEYDEDKIFDYLKEVSSNGITSMISGRIRKNAYRFEESLPNEWNKNKGSKG